MGCKPNRRIFINSMEEVKMEDQIPQNEQIQEMNQFSIHTSSIKTQYKLFPEVPLLDGDVLKDQIQIQQYFSFRSLNQSTIQQTPQPFSPDLTQQLLVKCMDQKEILNQSPTYKHKKNEQILDQSSRQKNYKHDHKDKFKKCKKKRLDMKTLEDEF